MRREWMMIIGAGLGISLLPACSPLLRPDPATDLERAPLSARSTAQGQDPAERLQAGATSASLNRARSVDAAVEPAARRNTVELMRYPATETSRDLIPPVAESSPAARVAQPTEPSREAASHPNAPAKPPEDPPLVEALRCFLNKQPAEAVTWLAGYDKPSQELLLCLLPLAVRLSEGGWDRYNSREASEVMAQLERVRDSLEPWLRCRAPLSIKKMCFCETIQGYGKYVLIPESHAFRPGEFAEVYVELQNLADQPQGNAYGIHVTSTLEIRDFNGPIGWRFNLPPSDRGPDLSQTERHDFYRIYTFRFPKSIPPGLYALYLRITDVSTGRTAGHTLDFRVISPYGKGEW